MALLIIGLLLVAVGGLLLYLRSRAEGRLLEIGFTDTVTAQEVRDLHAQIAAELGPGGFSQLVELKGKLRCAAPLTAELSGQPCAYYTMSVEERYEETYQEQDGEGGTRTATRTGSNIVATNTQSALFQLHDATGELDVNPTGAEVHPRQTVSRFEPFAGGPSITMGGFVLQVGVGLGGRRVLGYQYTWLGRSHGAGAAQRCSFIGDFRDGLARFALGGTLAGSMKPDSNHLNKLSDYLARLKSPVSMTDYTEYDQLFQKNALLICRDCQWVYIDTAGRIVVQAQYSFDRDFVKGVGIVSCEGKWGMVNRKAEVILPCRYDGVQFLENTDNQIIRVYIQQAKNGLIDTLGRLTVSAIYDEIGSFTEGRLAVKRNGLWGFVDRKEIYWK